MSNKTVPQTYRQIIDELITVLKADFDEHGVSEEVLGSLQSKWQAKVLASRVADFDQPSPPSQPTNFSQPKPKPTLTQPNRPPTASTPTPTPKPQLTPQPVVKPEPVTASIPPPPGRASNSRGPLPSLGHGMYPGQPGMSYPHMNSIPPLPPLAGAAGGSILMLPRGAPPAGSQKKPGTVPPLILPQVDGANGDDSNDEIPPHAASTRERMFAKYPWMREALERQHGSDVEIVFDLPQLDGPSSKSPPPRNNLQGLLNGSDVPPLPANFGALKSEVKGEIKSEVPPLMLGGGGSGSLHPSLARPSGIPPLPSLSASDIPPLSLTASPAGSSLSLPPSTQASRASSSANVVRTTSNFARNPNVPPQPSEDINSDLDDSEEEDVDEPNGMPADPQANVIYCTYDKVTRVKTKWKVVFRDGVIRANSKDYLFGRCNGEFDW